MGAWIVNNAHALFASKKTAVSKSCRVCACRHFAGTHHQNCFLNYLIIKKFFADVGW